MHLAWVRKHLCALWERQECWGKVDAAHLRDLCPEIGMGTKPSDIWAIALCRKHHDLSEGRERSFCAEYGINPDDWLAQALEYAAKSDDLAARAAAKEWHLKSGGNVAEGKATLAHGLPASDPKET